MRYKLFGRSGLRVSELALGTGTFGTRWGRGSDPAESRAVFDRYAEAGGNFVDTADVYQFGESEEILADLLAADRDHFVLGTKFTVGADPKGGVSRTGNSRKNIVRSLEESLRRLRTDRVDLYWAHMSDGMTPVDEVMRALDDLVTAGKVLYVGLSDIPAWRAARAATLAELRGWAPVAGLQVEYSLAERTAERELLPMAEGLGIGVTLWSPLGGGLLTGKQRRGEQGRHDAGGGPVRTEGERETAILDAVEATAAEMGATPAQVAIAWVRTKGATTGTAMVPILGARTVEQLDDNLGALDLALGDEHLARLDAVSTVPPGFPHEMLGSAQVRQMVRGGAEITGADRAVA
jgi:aryl-alcohol dehydrogenase-like predicted oxidoreductase